MLVAKNQAGELIYATEYRAPQKVFCPQCHQPVQLVVRQQQRPYFRHVVSHIGNNETSVHLQGKQWLAKWLHEQFSVQLEYVLDPKQRIDVYADNHQFRLAVEYQCSPISSKELATRQQQYLQKGLHPLWIFGPQHYRLKNQLTHSQALLSFNQPWGYYILYKLPRENFLRLCYHFALNPGSRQLFWQMKKIYTWTQLLQFQAPLSHYQIATIDWSQWYLTHCRYPDQQFIQLQNWCYQQRQNLLDWIKKTPSQTVFPIYKYLGCYLPLVYHFNIKAISDFPLINSEITLLNAKQDWQQFVDH